MAIKSYRDLEVWRQAMKLAELCYKETNRFPSRETYGMANQIRRAAVSIASNIAEGNSRRTRQAYLNHLSIALGSQSELETQVELSRRLELFSENSAQDILELAEVVGRMLHSLIRSLEQKGSECTPHPPAPSP
jgi:four helix bundle protein